MRYKAIEENGLDDLSKEEIAILDKYYDKLDYLRDVQKEKERHKRQQEIKTMQAMHLINVPKLLEDLINVDKSLNNIIEELKK